MDRIVETMRDLNLQESWGEVIDVTEFMTDSTGFFNTNGLGAFTQIYDRADGRFRPVYTNESDLKLIRAMSWLLVEKVPMAQAWVNRLLDYTIGTGFDWTIKAEDKRLEKAVQLYVRETLDNSRWSSELERESYVREVADGEFLGELVYDDGQCLLVAHEADELTEPAIKGELEDWLGIDFVPSWTFGVLTKQNLPERPIGYHFVRNSAGTDWDYVPAERVCLWKRNVRSRGKRGFSDFYKPHLYLLRADRVLTNTAEGAATQAAIAYIVEHRDGTQRQADNIVKRFAPPTGKVDPLTGLAQRRRRMLPGTRLDVPEGQQYKAGLLGSNNSDIYISVMEAALRLAGSVHAFPEGMLTGSYENNNFASALVAEGPFMQGRMAEQAQRKERMREMLVKIIKHAANKRRFAAIGFDSWEQIEQVLTVEVIPSRIIPMDPLKTAQALAIQKQNGWVSDKTCINELGRDIDTETANGLKVGGAEQQPGAAGQQSAQGKPGGSPSDLGNVSNEDGKWLGLSRLQWQRNRKAVADVLTDFANGKTRRSVAKVLLRAIGMPEPDIETMLRDAMDGQIDSLPPESMTEAEKKTLNKPFRTPGGPKKFGVYVKNAKGNVIKLPFGDPKMKIKRDDPGRRRGFRSRHNCQDPGPKWKARYWSCRFWSKPSVTKLLKESFQTGDVPWDGRTFVRESWLLKTNPALAHVRLLEEKDGDGDGFVNDGKPSERPVDNKREKKSAPTKRRTSNKKVELGGKYRAWIDENDPQMWQASDWDGSEFGALQIWVSGGAKEINSNPNSSLSKSMQKIVDSIPNAKVDTIYRVLNFKNSNDAESYIESIGNGSRQTKPFASWTSINPDEDPDGVAANVSGGVGGYKVILRMQKPSQVKDVSFLYHGSEYDKPGVELLTTKGQEFTATGFNKSGNKFTVDVSESLMESFFHLREEKDGDGDGMVNDGKPSERPAETKQPKATKTTSNASVSKAILNLSSKAKGKPLAAFLNANNAENFGPAWDKAGPQAKPIHGIEFSHENLKTNKLFPSEYDSWDEDPSDPKHVAKLADAFKSGEKIKPVLVHLESDGATVIDGHHRVKAAMKAGIKDVPVIYTAESLAKIWKDANADFLKPETKSKSPSKLAKEYADFRLRSALQKKESLTESLTENAFTEAFCETGEGGGIKNDCPPKRQPKLPPKPVFVSSDERRNLENDKVVQGLIDMFNKADVAGLRAVEHPSPKVQAYAKSLRAALAVAGVQGDNPIDLFGSTEVMHTENGKYTEKRRKLHAAIYEQLLAGAEPVKNPTFVLLGGGSASGKSALIAGTVPAIPASVVRVDADQIKSMLPEYAALSGKDSRAAAFAHNESAFMAKELASLAASRGYNTMLDGTGNGSESGLAKKVNIAKKNGMKVVAVYATTDLQTAIARNRERAKTEGRMVPQSFLEYSHQQVSALFPKFVRNGSFDEAHLYDTTGKKPKKIATLNEGEFVVHDQAAYNSFLRKAGE